MAEVTEKLAWTAIILSLIMQVFASLFMGTGLLTTFDDLPNVTDAISGFAWLGTFVVDLFQVISGFVLQSWAAGFPAWLHFGIIVLLDLPILLLLAGYPIVLIVTAVAAIIGALGDIF